MKLVVNTIKLEKSMHDQVVQWAEAHHMNKSDFMRQAIRVHLQELQDLEAFERTRGDHLYSLHAVEKALGLDN